MNKTYRVTVVFILLAFLSIHETQAETNHPEKWSLKACIEYAKSNNIQVRKAKRTSESQALTLQQSKEGLYPSLSAGGDFSLANRSSSSVSTSYGLNMSMTLFNGMRNYNEIRQNKLYLQTAGLNEQVTTNDIILSITEAYLQILYAHENLETAKQALSISTAEVLQSQNLLNAGSITRADFSQVLSQQASDQYSIVTAENNYSTSILSLKQLLELDVMDSFDVVLPDLKEAEVLKTLPEKTEVYQTALQVMPEMKSSSIDIQIAEYDLKNAKSGYSPTVSLKGSLGSSTTSTANGKYGRQLSDNFNQSLGLSVSIPIYSNGSNRTSVQKAKKGIESAKLEYTNTEKTLLKTVESLYQDAVASQSKYLAAKQQLQAAKETYNLTEQQFGKGLKTTLELLTARTNYLTAQLSLTQAKYGAVLSLKLLQFYQNKPIEI
jgi:outer membrane protein